MMALPDRHQQNGNRLSRYRNLNIKTIMADPLNPSDESLRFRCDGKKRSVDALGSVLKKDWVLLDTDEVAPFHFRGNARRTASHTVI